MIKFLQHDMIDKSRWDDCISNALNGNLNAFSWFLDIVSPGWCALIEDDYEKVFPLPTFSRAGIKYIMQPYFTQQLGLFYRSLSSEKILLNFLDGIPKEYKYIDINLNTSNKVTRGKEAPEMINLELDMISDYGRIASAYTSNLQRNINKAAKNKLSITKHIRPEDVIALFKAGKGLELNHLRDSQYSLMQRIAYESIYKDIGEVWGVHNEFNQLVAGVLWVTSHQKTIFLFSAVSGEGKKLHAMPFLIDTFIRENAGKPLTLDFEGSNDPGLARFYSSFGAKRVVYQRYVHNLLPVFYRTALKIWRLSRKLVKKSIRL